MAASNGTLVLVSTDGRRTYTVDMYIPDATGTLITFNPSGLAASTSPTTWRAPEDVRIVDFVTVAAPTAVGASLQINNATANGGTIRHANQLCTLATRMKLNVPIRAGDFIGYTQF